MIWSDEFNGGVVDSNKWSHEITPDSNNIGGNWELQYYTDDSTNSYIGNTTDGNNEPVTGLFIQAANKYGQYATSARLNTLDKFHVTYGRIEARIKVASGAGMWPAFWMLGVNGREPDFTWPLSGEIDIMEIWGDSQTDSTPSSELYSTIHYGDNWPNNEYLSSQTRTIDSKTYTDFGDDFHVYAVEWTEAGIITWYFDGIQIAQATFDNADGEYAGKANPDYGWYTETDEGSKTNANKAPFDKPFYLILNLAVGGGDAFTGKIDDAGLLGLLQSGSSLATKVSTLADTYNSFDGDNATMVVDYVRVFGIAGETEYSMPNQSTETLEY